MIIEVLADIVEKADLASLEILKGYYTNAENRKKLMQLIHQMYIHFVM